MTAIGPSYNQIFNRDYPIIIATNRSSAVLLPVRLAFVVGGYVAGQILARKTSDGLFYKYDNAGAGGLEIASAILFEPIDATEFPGGAGSVAAVGIFGGCTVFKGKLTGWNADASADLGAKEITDATGVTLLKF